MGGDLPPYIYGREAGANEKVWTEQAVRAVLTHPSPVQRPVWVDVAIRGDMARAVFDAIRVAVPGLGSWQAFDALEVQRMTDALKPYVPFIPQPAQRNPLMDEDCTRIYNEANGITTKNPPITTERIFKAMRAAHSSKE